jgi:hypothetical protein
MKRLQRHILKSEDLSSEKELSLKAKHALVVKKTGNMLNKKVIVLKEGLLKKQGEQASKKVA